MLKRINLFLLFLIIISSSKPLSSSSYTQQIRSLGESISKKLEPYYEFGRIYSGTKSLLYLADILCSADNNIATLPINIATEALKAVLLTSCDFNKEQFCEWLPTKYNWLASLIINAIPEDTITGTATEASIRYAIGVISNAATAAALLPIDCSIDYSNAIDYDGIGLEL